MDEEIDRLVIGVRADTGAFTREVEAMKAGLSGGLGAAAESAGGRIETALVRAARGGKIGFDDLRKVALATMNEIANSAIRGGIGAVTGGGAGGGGGLLGTAGTLLAGLIGAPGRATGGPVAPGRAYTVGERGPELFVPTASGRIETGAPGRGAREVRVSINVAGGGDDRPQALARSGRQVARAVRRAIEQAGD